MESEQMSKLGHGAWKTYQDRIFTLATASLALSVTFRGSLVGPSAHYVWFLQTAWVSLVVCVVTLTWSQALEGGMWLAADGESKEIRKRFFWGMAATHLIGGSGFILGIVFLTGFALLNIK